MSNCRCQFLFGISVLALLISALALGQSHVTVHEHGLASVTGLTDPNALNEDWQTPLMAAASRADERAVKDLIARKANINVGDRFGETALMYARYLPINLLVGAGAFVNDKDITGKTALYYATARADPDVVRVFVKAGANVNVRDDKGMSVLHLAKLQLPAENITDKGTREAYQSRVRLVIDLLVRAGASDDHP